MAMNPMQRKANNSFLLGIVITLLITGLIIAFLIYQIMDLNKTIEEQELALTKVYVLSEDVKSGQIITNDLLMTMEVPSDTVPSNAVADVSTFDSYFLTDEQGNQAYTGYKLTDTMNLFPNIAVNSEGYKILSGADYDGLNDQQKAQIGASLEQTQYISRNGENCEIKYDDTLEEYYILVPETNAQNQKQYTKEMLETMPLLAKIDIYANSVITPDMVSEGQLVKSDVRTQEFNVIIPLTQLETGDYIDVRLRTPDGRDLIVVSKKEVTIPEIEGIPSATTMWIDLSEEETLMMSSAIVESYMIQGAKLYAARYVEPGMQDGATETYVPNDETRALIENDPNIVEEAKNELLRQMQINLVRPGIDSLIDPEEAADSVTDGTEEEITSLQEERESYVESLGE